MTRRQLQACTKKTLLDLARRQGIAGWREMTKEELVSALAKRRRRSSSPTPKRMTAAARDTSNAPSGEEQIESSKYHVGVPTRDLPAGYGKDRIVLMVRDPYWLHCYWELTHQAIARAEAALGQEWHTAKPILRLLDVSS